MFIRTKTTPNSPRRTVQIVENIRFGKLIKQKIIRYVGVAMDEQEEELLKSLANEYIAKITKERIADKNSLFDLGPHNNLERVSNDYKYKKRGRRQRKKIEDILPISKVTLDRLVEHSRITEGVEEIAGPLYETLGYNKLLKKQKDNQILKDIIFTRLIYPLSKLKSQQILKEKFGKEQDLDCIYRMMDKLHPLIDQIKILTFENTKRLFPNGIDVVLFDVTTLYMESVEADELKEFGYSKDCKFGQVQVVLALATNSEGLPVGYELFQGNTAEVKTLIASIEKWKKLFKIQSVCFVGDRAMFSKNNLEAIESAGHTYVIAAKLKSLKEDMKSQILDEKNYRPAQYSSSFGWIGEFNHEGRRLIVNYKTSRAKHDQDHRNSLVKKVEKTIGKNKRTETLVSNQAIKKFTKTTGDSKTEIDETKIIKSSLWDGLHGIITNIKDERAEKLIEKYSRLWIIEESFRINKHTLSMRPIYHWKPQRIEAHIAICYVTFALLRQLEYRIKLTKKIPVTQILEALMNVQSSILIDKKTGDKYKMPSKMTHTASSIYLAFNIQREIDPSIYLS